MTSHGVNYRPSGNMTITKPPIVAVLGGWRATAFALLALCALTATGVQTMRLKYQEGRVAKWAAEAARLKFEGQFRAQVAAEELERLRKSAPKAGASVREIVRERPSPCVVPAAPRLRDAVRASNASRGAAGAVPGDA